MKEKNTEISARIDEIICFLHTNPNKFANALGYNRAQTVYDILSGKSAPSYDFFNRFAMSGYSAFINLHWLLTGKGNPIIEETYYQSDLPIIKGEMTAEQAQKKLEEIKSMKIGNSSTVTSTELPVATPATNPGEGIPLIPIDAMAGVLSGEQTVLEYECERYVVPVFKGADFLIPVKGSSMYPKYSSGDIVACQRVPMTDLFFQWNKVYVIDTTQGALIKRIKPGSDKDHVLIVSDNEKYDPFELPYSAIHAVALVIGVIRLE